MTFAMVVTSQPKSVNSGTHRGYQRFLGEQARTRMSSKPLMTGSLYIRINWFFNKAGGPDVDNIIKSIVDAMRTIVYLDDSIFVKALACKHDLRAGTPPLSDRNIPVDVADVFDELVENLGILHDGILYIEVGHVQSDMVEFGQIDGGLE